MPTVNTTVTPTAIENPLPPTVTAINDQVNGHQPPAIATSQSNTASDTAGTANTSSGASLNQLRELMDMYKEGLLSQAEFEAAKTKLLGL